MIEIRLLEQDKENNKISFVLMNSTPSFAIFSKSEVRNIYKFIALAKQRQKLMIKSLDLYSARLGEVRSR